MPFELNNLLSNKAWVEVAVGDDVLRVAYLPASTSLRKQAELQRALREIQAATEMDEMEQVKRAALLFCELVCDWDMTLNGVPLPVTPETASSLPMPLFGAIMEAITSDRQEGEAEKKVSRPTSGAGSQQEDKLEVVQNGIPSSGRPSTWA